MTDGQSATAAGAATGNPYAAAAGAVIDGMGASGPVGPSSAGSPGGSNVFNIGAKDKGLLGNVLETAGPVLIAVVVGWAVVKVFD